MFKFKQNTAGQKKMCCREPNPLANKKIFVERKIFCGLSAAKPTSERHYKSHLCGRKSNIGEAIKQTFFPCKFWFSATQPFDYPRRFGFSTLLVVRFFFATSRLIFLPHPFWFPVLSKLVGFWAMAFLVPCKATCGWPHNRTWIKHVHFRCRNVLILPWRLVPTVMISQTWILRSFRCLPLRFNKTRGINI